TPPLSAARAGRDPDLHGGQDAAGTVGACIDRAVARRDGEHPGGRDPGVADCAGTHSSTPQAAFVAWRTRSCAVQQNSAAGLWGKAGRKRIRFWGRGTDRTRYDALSTAIR